MMMKDGSQENLEIKDCVPSGILNPKNPCTQEKIERFTDPTDGVEKFVYTLAIVQADYNPKHIEAEASGYYAKVVDNQQIFVIFETIPDLIWQLEKISRS
jgi:hypothetical protein